MARPVCSLPIPWGDGPEKIHPPSISSSHSSASIPTPQHPPQSLLSSHTLSTMDTLPLTTIKFIKTQTTSVTFTEDQTAMGFGHFSGKNKRKGNPTSSNGKASKMVRRDSSAKNVDDEYLSGDKLLEQSQPARWVGVAAEDSTGEGSSKISASKIKQSSPQRPGISLKEKPNKSEESASEATIKLEANRAICTESGPVFSRENREKTGLNEVPCSSKLGSRNGSYIKPTAFIPDSTTAPLVSPRKSKGELGSTVKSQFENPKLKADPIATASGKTMGKSVLRTKPGCLSKESPKRPNKDLRVKGLTNLSYFCYRNSVLQLFSSSTVFIEEISEHIKRKCYCGPNCTSCALGKFFQNHFRPARGELSVNRSLPVVSRLRNVLPEPFGRTQCNQEDASEYMLALLNKGVDQLKSAPNHTNSENHFDRIFGAKYDSVLTCPLCNNRSVTPEYQLNLQLAIKAAPKAQINLNACFANNFSEEYVEASCDKCGHKTGPSGKSKRFVKKTEIRKLPKFLVITLSRYKIGRLAQTKIMNSVKLEEKLVLREGNKDVTYELKGMICHKGAQVRSGHYIAFTKQPDRTWAKCDDAWITKSNLECIKLHQKVFQIYMLGYEQVTC